MTVESDTITDSGLPFTGTLPWLGERGVADVEDWQPSLDVVAKPPTPSWYMEFIPRVTSLLELESDWDSYGSAPPSFHSVVYALTLVHQVGHGLPEPAVTALAGGGVALIWASEQGKLEIEIEGAGQGGYFFVDRQGNEEPIESDDLNPVAIQELAARV